MKNLLVKSDFRFDIYFFRLTVAFIMAAVLIMDSGVLFLTDSFASMNNLNSRADSILVAINDRKVTVQDFLDFYKTRPRIARWHSSENNQKDPLEILEALIGKILMVQEAYTLFPHILKRYERDVAAFEQRCLIDFISEKEISQGIEISEQEIFKRIPEERKIEVHLRRIVTATEQEALSLKKQLVDGADFVSLAKKYSLGEEAQRGGDIGYMTFDKGIFPKKAVEEIFQLKEGKIGNPAKIREGFALFQVIEKRKVDTATLERVKQYIRQQITLERKRERWDQLLEQLKKDSTVIVNEALFKEIELSMTQGQGEGALKRMSGLEIARIKSRPIRLGEIIPNSSDTSLGGAKPWERDVASLRRILDRRLRVFLFSEYARQNKYDQSPEIKKNVSRFKEDLMVKQLITEKVYKGLTIGLEECRIYYQKHLSEYLVPEQVRIDEIVVQDKVTATDLLHQLQKGTDFTKLSKQYSAPEALRLKDFFAKGESGMGKEFEEKVFNLQPGQISEIIKTYKEFHIVKLLERRKEGITEFLKVESEIREKLLPAKKEKTLSDYIASLRQKSQIIINKPLFQEVVANVL